jgi:hypothetical protein
VDPSAEPLGKDAKMIFEWYSGSDSSKRVAARIASYNESYDRVSHEGRIASLKETLELEEDRNWRGYLLAFLGADYESEKRIPEATEAFAQAIAHFEPFAANFLDVVEQYCWAMDGLIRREYTDDAEPRRLAIAAMNVFAFLDMTAFTTAQRSMVLGWLARAFTTLGYRTGDAIFHALALPVALRAHHLDPDESAFLRELVYCYFNLKDAIGCQRAYDAYLAVEEPSEAREQVMKFMAERFSEIADPDSSIPKARYQ